MTKPPLANPIASLLAIIVLTPTLVVPTYSIAGDGTESYSSSSSVVERELSRRRDYEARGRVAVAAGNRAMEEKDYETAVQQFKLAADIVPNSENTEDLYEDALEGFCEATIKLAEQRITEGRYADAEALCRQILSDRYDPRCKGAILLLSNLETPGYYNKTIGPIFRGKVEQVKKLLLESEGFYETGRYDMAFKRCEQVLNLDPYNIAARKMEEKINVARDNYAVTAYNEARSRAIWKVDDAWGNPVRKFGVQSEGIVIQPEQNKEGTDRINAKLQRIVIPRLEFREATIREAVDFLKKKSVELDTQEPDPARKGVNIVLKLDSAPAQAAPAPDAAAPVIPGLDQAGGAAVPTPSFGGLSPGDARITVALSNIPLNQALKYVTDLANLKYKVEQYAVSIVPLGTNTDVLITKQYSVPPNLFSRVASPDGGGASLVGAAPADATRGGTGIAARMDAKEFLVSAGVTFPPGATANYFPNGSRLVVRNTQDNQDLIETLIQNTGPSGGPTQVEIESKFVEITQNNLKELSFDWLLGQSNVPRQQSVFVSGGTAGNTPGTSAADFPFARGNTPIGGQPITAGNRSGGAAIGANAIDALLFGLQGNSLLAPGVAAVAGVFTDPQFQLVIRAINQKKGVDLLSAPKVTTMSGKRAVIEIIREFRYPIEFDPPQIPQDFGDNGGSVSFVGAGVNPFQQQQQSSFPVTPTTPTSFETRNTGVTLEVEPVVGPDQFTIDLQLVPQVVEFEGFINYGSPIQTTSTNALGQSIVNVITPNVINQPIFSTRKVQTSISIFDGQTVVLGGLIREDVQKVEDKVPFLGDIPLLGRLFRSSVDQHLKRNLVIFVSARLITAAGQPFRLDEEKEEEVETLALPEAQELPLMPK